MSKDIKTINEAQDWLETNDSMCNDVMDKKYLFCDPYTHKKEDIKDFLLRITGNSDRSGEYYDIISNLIFMPAGRILANRGLSEHGLKVTYGNCFVLEGPEDNIESIYTVAKKMARTFSYGGGVGIDISKLAPKDANVNNSAQKSTGAVSFCETYSSVANTIGQHGRRGALMICIDDTHPDLIDFITHKSDLNITTGANMSVKFSDLFFSSLEENADWTMSFFRPETGETIEKTMPAQEIMNILAETAWGYAEPGILYWDRVNKYCLLGEDPSFKYEATNPCGVE